MSQEYNVGLMRNYISKPLQIVQIYPQGSVKVYFIYKKKKLRSLLSGIKYVHRVFSKLIFLLNSHHGKLLLINCLLSMYSASMVVNGLLGAYCKSNSEPWRCSKLHLRNKHFERRTHLKTSNKNVMNVNLFNCVISATVKDRSKLVIKLFF